MGRRSAHTPDELRQLVLDAAEEIIENDGLAGLSARQIARQIGYSPGTLYNLFANLDDLILHVEVRVLSRLDERLAAALADSRGEDALRRFATAYLAFSRERPRLWNLLFEHHMPASFAVPQWYQDKLEMPLGRLEAIIGALVGADDPVRVKRLARALWAGVHGLTSLSATSKVCSITLEAANELIEELVEIFLSGLVRTGRC